jgi:predicted dehydrogenase
MSKRIGYAAVGVGDIAHKDILPAFAGAAENSRLVAVVGGDRVRAQALAQEFGATA